MAFLHSFLASFPRVAVSGSRVPGSPGALSCAALLPHLSGFPGLVGVGCARGADSLVRSAFPSAVVFSVVPPVSRSSFALRSARLVRWVSSGFGLLVAFPSAPCPAGVVPSGSFAGFGSGTWGSVAFALGLGCPVLVVLPAALGCVFPAPFAVSSRFVRVGTAPCGGSLWYSPPAF